ncbi:3-deoxy-D-manno-octulosonic acid transferase [Brevundimonas sp. A19_0]|uniref:3-deoxy-D-manno-octulosonic acid transferase n=1 Tax=Brevundimonas sp. A19_0 TaxID=2821087 RepID=UPI001ADAEAD2|nr:3-deoxy-D-manno-octulosonic acid transferase [Brevundimonas sp. A19_0]MBO9500233.1 3-deoxy-D-manno-octulosonic acid transferase [Brevundimonas sp. A19_0]
MLGTYRLLTRLLQPLAPRVLEARARRGKEDPARLGERLGHAGVARPDGPLVWMHAISVGESLSLLPVIALLRERRPDLGVLVTTGTLTSARMMAQRLPDGVIHQYAPVDTPAAVSGFLDYWRPSLALFVESELWPNLILEARDRGVPLMLASARITAHTAEGWTRRPAAARALFQAFARILPQDEASAGRIRVLGGRDDGRVNLKLVGAPLPFDRKAFDRLSQAIGDRPVVVLASTHDGEEAALVQRLLTLDPLPFLIVVPRHPERSGTIRADMAALALTVAVRSRGEMPGPDTRVYLADTLNEMGLFLRLAEVVVLGGAFGPLIGQGPVGGHNPLEPARLARPTLTGPDMSNWSIAGSMVDAGGLEMLTDLSQLAPRVAALLSDPDQARQIGRQAEQAAASADGGLEVLWQAMAPLLPPAGGRR